MFHRCRIYLWPAISFLFIPVLGYAAEISIKDLTTNPAKYDGQTVTLCGTAQTVKATTSRKRNEYTTFQVKDGSGGPEYSRNSYDTRLGAAFQKYALGALPDLVVRTAQIYLIYLGYNPGSVNGITGRFTRSALNEFQQQHGLPITTDIGDAQLSALKGEVEKLEP